MTSRTRFCAPNPIASPAMPAPVRIGSTSIASSRSSIRIATNPTTDRHHARQNAAERRGAPLPFEVGLDVMPADLELQMLDRQVGGANDDVGAGDDDDDVDPVRRSASGRARAGSHRGSPIPTRESANEMLASAAMP